jgi:hypothetical protein
MAEPEDSFIARWSRRKRGLSPSEDTAAVDAPSFLPAEGVTDERETADAAETEIIAQLPDIESLDESADFTVFLQKGVPEELRKRALRRLWRLNPVFANLDGLNDYDEDFTDAATVLEGLKTLYQVGKGMRAPAEPRTGDADAGDLETSAAAAGEKAIPTGEDESVEEDHEKERRPIAQGEAIPVADQGELVGRREEEETTSVALPEDGARPSPGRSAAERRWGRFGS